MQSLCFKLLECGTKRGKDLASRYTFMPNALSSFDRRELFVV